MDLNTPLTDSTQRLDPKAQEAALQSFEPVTWNSEGSPFNERFKDIYRSKGTGPLSGLDQARHVFLAGCGLVGPKPLWQHLEQWSILETGFGLGLNFLATYHAWLKDPFAPKHLHYVSIEAYPVSAQDILRSTQAFEELRPLGEELVQRYWGLTPGFHRLTLAQGFVHLTLCIGQVQDMLQQVSAYFDSLYLDGFAPQKNPQMWNDLTMKGMAARAKWGAKASTWSVGKEVRESLQRAGFVCEKREGLPPKREALLAVYSPAWHAQMHAPRPALQSEPTKDRQAPLEEVVVVGAGLSGATTARALALRGFKVRVIDQHPPHMAKNTEHKAEQSAEHCAEHCAVHTQKTFNSPPRPLSHGAHGLPFGLFHPMNSRDDNLQSKMTRAGIRVLLDMLASDLGLLANRDFDTVGVLEKKKPAKRTRTRAEEPSRSPAFAASQTLNSEWMLDWSRPCTDIETAGLQSPGLEGPSSELLFHEKAGWVNVQAFLAALLDHPSIRVSASSEVCLLEGHLDELSNPTCTWRVHTRCIDQDGSLQVHEVRHLILSSSVSTANLVLERMKFTGPGAADVLHKTHERVQTWPLQAIKGQLSVGQMKDLDLQQGTLPGFAINGQSSWVGHLGATGHEGAEQVPSKPKAKEKANGNPDDLSMELSKELAKDPSKGPSKDPSKDPSGVQAIPPLFCMGSSYERGLSFIENTAQSRLSNLHKFKALLPGVRIKDTAPLMDWSGVRSTCHDRLPLVGTLIPELPSLLVCTALGSRGLSMSGVLAEHLCALITHEPSPLPKRLIQAIGPDRFLKNV